MAHNNNRRGVHPLWWTAALFATVIGLVLTCSLIFAGTFRRYVPVTLTSERSGLVMESGAKVKMRGVEVGRVAGMSGGTQAVALALEIDPDKAGYIPANVEAEIATTTAFGAKYVDLIYPEQPSAQRISAGAVLQSRNVATEVNTVFDNLVGLLNEIDVAKLSAVLTAVADGVRGQENASARPPPTPTRYCWPSIRGWTGSARTGPRSGISAMPTAQRRATSSTLSTQRP